MNVTIAIFHVNLKKRINNITTCVFNELTPTIECMGDINITYDVDHCHSNATKSAPHTIPRLYNANFWYVPTQVL